MVVPLASLVFVAPVEASWIGIPVGGLGSASDSLPNNIWTSTLNPNPALLYSSCPWITNGLNVQGFTAQNGWTIDYKTLNGSLKLEKYFAWVTNRPTETINGTSLGGGSSIDWGGADFRVLYTPGDNDPTGKSVDWIQAIYSDSLLNTPEKYAYNAGGGCYEYLDNEGTYTTNPNYDNNYGVNPTTSTEFLDIPSRKGAPYTSKIFQAQVFIDTFDADTKTIDIYGSGIWYGFNYTAVPEPSSLVMLGLGVIGLLARRRRAA